MTKEQTPTIDDLIRSFKELHERTTKGEWKQGHSSHETVSVHPAKTDAYHVADFRHANDASFVDFVHKHGPTLVAGLERIRSTTSSPVPEEVTRIHLREHGSELRKEVNCFGRPKIWVLYRGGEKVRCLDEFENDFVDSAVSFSRSNHSKGHQ